MQRTNKATANVFLILTLIFGGLSAQAQKVKEEIESGFKVSPSFAKKILKEYDFEKESRTDYYVEAYDGNQFLLNSHPGKFKFRIKVEADGATIQANTKAAVHPGSCEEGWKFNVSEKEVGELAASESQQARFVEGVTQQLELIQKAAPETVKNQALAFNEFLSKLRVPKIEILKQAITAPKWLFVATHSSVKKKWKTKTDVGYGKMAVSITHAKDYVGKKFVLERYEIEFELRGEMSIADFKESICELMRQNEPGKGDLSPDQESAADLTLSLLKTFNPALGF